MRRDEFRIGDRIEWVGPAERPGWPQEGEQGTVVDLDPMDDVISWDDGYTIACNIEQESIRLVPGAPRGSRRGRVSNDRLLLKVQGHLPERANPERSADRRSPNAAPLFEEAIRVERAFGMPSQLGPSPTQRPFGLVLTTAVPLSSHTSSAAANAIVEVLVDAGVIADERQEIWERFDVDTTMEGGYSVSLEFEPPPA